MLDLTMLPVDAAIRYVARFAPSTVLQDDESPATPLPTSPLTPYLDPHELTESLPEEAFADIDDLTDPAPRDF